MKNTTVVFTGFRDAALQKKVEDNGGRVTNVVSGKTDVLVVSGSKGVGSAKAAKARALGVRVTTREDFEKGFIVPPRRSRSRSSGMRTLTGHSTICARNTVTEPTRVSGTTGRSIRNTRAQNTSRKSGSLERRSASPT